MPLETLKYDENEKKVKCTFIFPKFFDYFSYLKGVYCFKKVISIIILEILIKLYEFWYARIRC